MAKKNQDNTITYVGIAALLGVLLLKNRNVAGIGQFQDGSKEFYEVMAMFEKSINKIVYVGGSFEKADKDLWHKGYYYNHGKMNELFKVYMSGYQLGTWM